jgi:hypothetical protein
MTTLADSHRNVDLLRRIDGFESKWAMAFAEFADACKSDTLEQDSYSYAVESDYWEWEAAVTLLADGQESESN